MQWYNWFSIFSFDTDFITWMFTFYQLTGRQCLLNLENLVVLSAGPISHNSICLLIITTDFVAIY